MIYINDLVDGLSSNAKLFADDTSLFSVVHNANTAGKEFNNHIVGKKKEYHPPLAFNDNDVSENDSQKHLGVLPDIRLFFEDHLKIILNKVNKTIRRLQNILPRSALLTI